MAQADFRSIERNKAGRKKSIREMMGDKIKGSYNTLEIQEL